VNIGLNGSFASWVGTIVPRVDQQILLIVDEGRQEEAILRLARVGYDKCLGFLQGGIDAWKNAGLTTDTILSVTAEEYHKHYDIVNNKILDVRKESEYNTEHIIGAQNIPLDYVQNRIEEVNPKKTTYVHCAAGYRSMIFVSLLRKKGFTNLINIEGGFSALKNLQKLPLSEYVVQSTEL
ncbi:MAG: rhodanese-like domain-containing protein, partial [Flavobacteriales bacterium]